MPTIPHSRPAIDQDDIDAVVAVLRSGELAQGERVMEFEAALASLVGARGAVAVSSGTAGLHLALRALGIGDGDEIVIPSFVCTALLHAILHVRAVPVLADIDPETYNIDPRDIRRRSTGRTKAVIVPHMFGLPADLREIIALGIPVIEDCAQALGSRCDGAPAGSFGVLSVFSFYATKVICTGEGGMVAANDRQLLEKIGDMRDYDEKEVHRLRFNCKMTDLQAALGLAQMRRLPLLIERRRAIARRYDAFLRERQAPVPARPPGRDPIYYRYVIRSSRAAEFVVAGAEAGVAVRRPVFKPLHHYLGMDGYPQTEGAFLETVSLPLYPSLSDAEVEAVLDLAGSVLQ